MKTVLHAIETSGPGGAERTLISLVERLDRNRYHPIICLLSEGWLNAQLKSRGFETVIIPQKRGLHGGWLIQLVKFIKRRHIDLMHTQEFAMNTYCSIASAIIGIPIVTTVQGKNYYADRWRRRLAYRFVSRQSRMVAVSQDIKRYLASQVGIQARRVATIWNGIDPAAFRGNNGGRAAVRNQLGLEERQPVIGTVGNLYPVKGHVYLLEAMALVVQERSDAVCLIAGRGQLEGRLRDTAAKLGIERNVRLLGFREDTPALLHAMDIFVLPSLSEGLSLALLEAMAASKPVIATEVGGNPEIVLDGGTGFLIPPRSAAALAEKILGLVKDPELAHHLGRSGQMRVEQEFSVTTMVQKYQDLYRRCWGHAGGPGSE